VTVGRQCHAVRACEVSKVVHPLEAAARLRSRGEAGNGAGKFSPYDSPGTSKPVSHSSPLGQPAVIFFSDARKIRKLNRRRICRVAPLAGDASHRAIHNRNRLRRESRSKEEKGLVQIKTFHAKVWRERRRKGRGEEERERETERESRCIRH